MKSLFIPDTEDFFITLNFPVKFGEEKLIASVEVEVFDLEQIFIDASNKGREMSTSSFQEFGEVFLDKYDGNFNYKNPEGRQLYEGDFQGSEPPEPVITANQARLLWDALQDTLRELKKSVRVESNGYIKQESPSNQPATSNED